MEEYETRTYMFEGGILEIEIPGSYERISLDRINPAQTDSSPLVKAITESER
jgi:hypothetical protein